MFSKLFLMRSHVNKPLGILPPLTPPEDWGGIRIVLFLILASACFAQPFPPDSVWTFAFDDGGDEYFYGMTGDGDGVILCGEAREWGALAGDALLVKVDLQGNLVWSRRFPDEHPSRFEGRYSNFESGRYVVQSRLAPDGTTTMFRVVRFDENFEQIDSVLFQMFSASGAYYAGYVIDDIWGISRTSYIINSADGYAAVHSRVLFEWTGDVTLEVNYPTTPFEYRNYLRSNGPYNAPVVVGYGPVSQALGMQGVIHLGSDENNGVTRHFGGPGADKFNHVTGHNWSSRRMVGSTTDPSNGSTDGWVVVADEDFDTVTARSYGGLAADEFVASFNSFDTLSLPNGYFCIGNYSSEDIEFEQSDFWVMGLDMDGDSLWSLLLGGPEAEKCYAVEGSYLGYMILGSSQSFAVPGWDGCAMFLGYVPDIAAAPGSLNFGPVAVGDSSSRSLGLINTGSNVLTVTEISSTANYHANFTGPATVEIGDTLHVPVVFTPQSPGTHVDTLRVTSDAISGVKNVRCLGAGTAAAADDASLLPTEFRLHPPYPNPFNPTATIAFDVPRDARVELTIFDVQGRMVATLLNGNLSAGTHSRDWTCSTCAGGVYFARLRTSEFEGIQKLVLIK